MEPASAAGPGAPWAKVVNLANWSEAESEIAWSLTNPNRLTSSSRSKSKA